MRLGGVWLTPMARPQNTRRTVENACLAVDALLRIKEQLPHGAWTAALKERGISTPETVKRLIREGMITATKFGNKWIMERDRLRSFANTYDGIAEG